MVDFRCDYRMNEGATVNISVMNSVLKIDLMKHGPNMGVLLLPLDIEYRIPQVFSWVVFDVGTDSAHGSLKVLGN